MSGLELAALALVAVWLVVLTVVVLVLVRQVSLLSIGAGLIDVVGASRGSTMLIGRALPDDLLAEVPSLREPQRAYLLWVSSTCSGCLDFVDDLRRSLSRLPMSEPIVALVSGGSGAAADALAAAFPESTTIVRDPLATDAAIAIGAPGTPYAIEVDGGVVTGWNGVHSAADLRHLRRASRRSAAAQAVETTGGDALNPDAVDEDRGATRDGALT